MIEQNLAARFSILTGVAQKVVASLDFSLVENCTVLVTGANGLLGLNFVVSLVELSKTVSGIEVVAVVRSDPSDILLALERSKKLVLLRGDLTENEFLTTLPDAEFIFHAAGSGVPAEFLKHPLAALKINTTTTFALVSKLKKDGRFLFISSSDVYNGLESSPYREEQIGTTNTNHPRSCYIEGKRTGEAICNVLHSQGVHAHAVRLSATYGPGVSYTDSRVLPSFIRKALDGSIDLLDSGEASRTFCYVADALEMMWFILLNGRESLYNVGGNELISVKHLAALIGRIMNVPVSFPLVEEGMGGAPRDNRLDLTRYSREHRKTTFVGLDAGLHTTIEWIRLSKPLNTKS